MDYMNMYALRAQGVAKALKAFARHSASGTVQRKLARAIAAQIESELGVDTPETRNRLFEAVRAAIVGADPAIERVARGAVYS